MKVFISWSGELSRELAEALRDWLPAVLQSVKPFFTPNDIEKGARWGKDISQELQSSAVGIFCLTKENLTKPWIMFEAGALSKQIDSSRVCPVLFGVESADLEGPLVQFQASPFSEVEMKKLIRTMNTGLGDQKLDDGVLKSLFYMWWPKLSETVAKILEKYQSSVVNPSGTRSDRDLLEEVLELARLNASSPAKISRRANSVDPSALRYSFKHIFALCEQLRDEEVDDLWSTVREIFAPLKFIAEQAELTKRSDSQLEEVIRKVEEFLADKI
jgi:hypothetical protein